MWSINIGLKCRQQRYDEILSIAYAQFPGLKDINISICFLRVMSNLTVIGVFEFNIDVPCNQLFMEVAKSVYWSKRIYLTSSISVLTHRMVIPIYPRIDAI